MKLFKRFWTWIGHKVYNLNFWKLFGFFVLLGLSFIVLAKVLNFYYVLYLILIVAFAIIFSPQGTKNNYRIKIQKEKDRFERILKSSKSLHEVITEKEVRESFECEVKMAKINQNGELLSGWVSDFNTFVIYTNMYMDYEALQLKKRLFG